MLDFNYETSYNITLSEIQNIYDSLGDDESRDIFMKRLCYSITKDQTHIASIVEKYMPEFTYLESWGGIEELYSRIPDGRKFYIYGAGYYGKKFESMILNNENFLAYVDRDEAKQASGFIGKKVVSPQYLLRAYNGEKIIIASLDFEREISNYLVSNGISSENILLVGSFIGRAKRDQYFDFPFFTYDDKEEVFIDAGSHNLATTGLFQKLHPNCTKVIAFEPDTYNYQVCKKNIIDKNYKNVELINAGTWCESTTLMFDERHSDSSRISEQGANRISVKAIDDVVTDEKVTFIKMDVEGAEYQSLLGADKVIRTYTPKLAICLYHKPVDILAIPMLIKRMVPAYKMFIRHNSNASNETVLYCMR
jgi:FkbM family methyltransferase